MRSTPPDTRSRGQDLADRLDQARKQAQRLPRPGTAEITMVHGVGPTGIYTLPAANVLQDVQSALLATGRVYALGDRLVYDDSREQGNSRLVSLSENDTISSAANAIINQRIMAEAPSHGDTAAIQYPLHVSVLRTAYLGLRRSPELRAIKVLAKRPVYASDFVLCGAGWNEASRTLVHARDLEPEIPDAAPSPNTPAIERLPLSLRGLLGRFCFQAEADLVNTLACALTALLVPRFVDFGKPLVIIDGNQPGLGKTLLANVLGVIWDGVQPRPIAYTPDNEELAKRICAELRSEGTVLLIDNARRGGRKPLESTVLESQCLSAQVSLRLLGHSTNFVRSNDILWITTMNDTTANEDLISRSIPIRLHWDGSPLDRDLADEDPITYAIENRYEILAELAGMIESWKHRGQPISARKHRCKEWARIIGGILEANGFPEFLRNLTDASSDFSQTCDELSRLAEHVLTLMLPAGDLLHLSSIGIATPAPLRSQPISAGRWIELFRMLGVCIDRLGPGASRQSMVTIVGNFLSRKVNRSVTAVVGSQTWRATLQVQSAAGNAKEYFFEFSPAGHPNLEPGPLRNH